MKVYEIWVSSIRLLAQLSPILFLSIWTGLPLHALWRHEKKGTSCNPVRPPDFPTPAQSPKMFPALLIREAFESLRTISDGLEYLLLACWARAELKG